MNTEKPETNIEPALELKNLDSRGPTLHWFTDWNEFPVGTKFYTQPVPATPIEMILHCPSCGLLHVDKATEHFKNDPHRSHLCGSCGHIWRPADVPTTGVASIRTAGKDDFPVPARSVAGRSISGLLAELPISAGPITPAMTKPISIDPAVTLHDDGYWTHHKTVAGRALNDRLSKAGSREGVYTLPQLSAVIDAVCHKYSAANQENDSWVKMIEMLQGELHECLRR